MLKKKTRDPFPMLTKRRAALARLEHEARTAPHGPAKPAHVYSARNPGTVYYTYACNVDPALRNGSFLRRTSARPELVQFMNGDCMGVIELEPGQSKYVEVPTEHAERLIPRICGGEGYGG